MNITIHRDIFPIAGIFTISRGSRAEAEVVRVVVEEDGFTGSGECVPYARYGETVGNVIQQIEALRPPLSLESLQHILPPGAARNAVDCALWDLWSKQSGTPVWKLAGLRPPVPQITAYTLSLDTPEKMQQQAHQNRTRPLLKIKLGGEEDMARLEAVRSGAPDARLIVDANEGWNAELYRSLAPALYRLGVELVEQPLPAGNDETLREMERVVPVCADESCHDRSTLSGLQGKYDLVNIKLDKTGGLTEALALKKLALQQGFGIMVGCMVASSLAMAPAVLLAQDASVVDLDGPLLLATDRTPPLVYDETGVHPPSPQLWG